MAASAVPRGGVVLVDKPSGLTSHDVVNRLRRAAGTRRVGHAGTLDPMATGLLVVGVGQATRLLGHLSLAEKSYVATARLGVSTNTDDADGDVSATADARAVSRAQVADALLTLTGEIQQTPPAYSAIQVGGVRAYAAARRGDPLHLAPRTVTVGELVLGEVRAAGEVVDVDLSVTCSTGTYIRALARDLGSALGVGGHLTALRRTSAGPFAVAAATPLDELADESALAAALLSLDAAAARCFAVLDVDADEAARVAHGQRLPLLSGVTGVVAVYDPNGRLVALAEPREDVLQPLAVFADAS